MREILFRGIVKGTNEWIYGFYNQWSDGKPKISGRFRGKEDNLFVVPDSIGEYTGLKDKNGTRIFELDIVRRTFAKQTFDYIVKYNTDLAEFELVDVVNGGTLYMFKGTEGEVIGNIHDNTELLKEV